MVCVIVLSLLGLFASVNVRLGWLTCIMWTLVVMFFFHLIGAVTITVWGVEESPVLTNELSETFLKLVYEWDENPRSSRILKQIQEYVGCCGADGSDDFINAKKEVPYECRDRTNGCEYGYGCQQGLAWWLEPWSGFLAASSVLYMLTDVFLIWIIRRTKNFVLAYEQHYGEY